MNRKRQIVLPFTPLEPFMFHRGDSTDPDQRVTLTNKELADRIGVTMRTIVRWRETGVPLSYFYEMCKVFNVRPNVREVMREQARRTNDHLLNDPILGPVFDEIVADSLDAALTTGDTSGLHYKRTSSAA